MKANKKPFWPTLNFQRRERMPKGIKDIKTSTGARSKVAVLPKIKICLGREGNIVCKRTKNPKIVDWDGSTGSHLFQRTGKRSSPPLGNWRMILEWQIKQLDEQISELESFSLEDFPGSEEFIRQLKTRRVLLQEMSDSFYS